MRTLAERRELSARLGARYYTLARHRDTRMRRAIAERLPADGAFLDVGCGAKLLLARWFLGSCRLSVGVDLEAPARPAEARLGALVSDAAALGLASASIDVAAMRSVSEHLPRPREAFRELARVLKPGGAAVILCPNKWYYSSMLGRLVPASAAPKVLRLIFGRNTYDNFPTYYRANTRRAIRRLAAQSGLVVEGAEVCEHPPDYLKLSPLLYQAGVWYDRLTTRWRPLHGLAVSYLFVLRKPGGAGAPASRAPAAGAAR